MKQLKGSIEWKYFPFGEYYESGATLCCSPESFAHIVFRNATSEFWHVAKQQPQITSDAWQYAEVKVSSSDLELIWIINLFNKSILFLFPVYISIYSSVSIRRARRKLSISAGARRHGMWHTKRRGKISFCIRWLVAVRDNLNCKKIFLRHSGM